MTANDNQRSGTTTVVHVDDEYDVYIGRVNHWRGLKASPYANPFRIGLDGTRDEVIEKYRDWLLAQPDLVKRARRELTGKRLACWCRPERCHGDVLVEVIGLGAADYRRGGVA